MEPHDDTQATESVRSSSPRTLQEVREENARNMRQIILDAAVQLLEGEGPEALTVRRLAEKLECSTKIVYSQFGGKEGLARHLYLEGCHLLARLLHQAPREGDWTRRYRALAWAYWDFALNHPGFYKLMFGGGFTAFKPDVESSEGTVSALQQLTELIDSGIKSGVIRNDRKELLLLSIWSSLHGVIQLHISGHLDVYTAKAAYEYTVDMLLGSFSLPW